MGGKIRKERTILNGNGSMTKQHDLSLKKHPMDGRSGNALQEQGL